MKKNIMLIASSASKNQIAHQNIKGIRPSCGIRHHINRARQKFINEQSFNWIQSSWSEGILLSREFITNWIRKHLAKRYYDHFIFYTGSGYQSGDWQVETQQNPQGDVVTLHKLLQIWYQYKFSDDCHLYIIMDSCYSGKWCYRLGDINLQNVSIFSSCDSNQSIAHTGGGLLLACLLDCTQNFEKNCKLLLQNQTPMYCHKSKYAAPLTKNVIKLLHQDISKVKHLDPSDISQSNKVSNKNKNEIRQSLQFLLRPNSKQQNYKIIQQFMYSTPTSKSINLKTQPCFMTKQKFFPDLNTINSKTFLNLTTKHIRSPSTSTRTHTQANYIRFNPIINPNSNPFLSTNPQFRHNKNCRTRTKLNYIMNPQTRGNSQILACQWVTKSQPHIDHICFKGPFMTNSLNSKRPIEILHHVAISGKQSYRCVVEFQNWTRYAGLGVFACGGTTMPREEGESESESEGGGHDQEPVFVMLRNDGVLYDGSQHEFTCKSAQHGFKPKEQVSITVKLEDCVISWQVDGKARSRVLSKALEKAGEAVEWTVFIRLYAEGDCVKIIG